MQVTNNTTFSIVAYCWHKVYGHGEAEVIKPGETQEVSGPLIADTDEGKGYIHVPGEITCHETPDDKNGFQVTPEIPLNLEADKKGITVQYTTADIVII